MEGRNRVFALYKWLFDSYGPQGWWPLIKNGRMRYHPGDYAVPKKESGRFQVAIGAILAQNTGWKNAEMALLSLYHAGALSFDVLKKMPETKIAALIKSSGYYNQKAKKIRNFLSVYPSLRRCEDANGMRKMLLSVKGIGPETADSILLYAYSKPFFVVDAYTRKFCAEHGICGFKDYEEYRAFFEKNLPRDFRIYNEYHALIVAWGKGHTLKKPRILK